MTTSGFDSDDDATTYMASSPKRPAAAVSVDRDSVMQDRLVRRQHARARRTRVCMDRTSRWQYYSNAGHFEKRSISADFGYLRCPWTMSRGDARWKGRGVQVGPTQLHVHMGEARVENRWYLCGHHARRRHGWVCMYKVCSRRE